MKKLFTLILAVVIITSAFAQAPKKMSYQAVIRDASNNLVTSHPVGMQISILQGSATGTVIYKELYNPNPQTNANGLVTVEIGSGLVITGVFDTINWGNGTYYVKTETDPTGGTNYTIAGASQLLSVPYALYATTAGNGFSGNYNDLTNKPTIPAAQVQTDWNVNSGIGVLLNKPTLATVATSGNYNDLNNLPNLGWSLTGNAGTNQVTNFIGTTDNVAFNIRVNNQKAGRIDPAGSAFYGYQAGNVNTAINNTAIGNKALLNNTTAGNNIAIGANALSTQSYAYSGTAWNSDNVAIGYYALFANQPTSTTNGIKNLAIGNYSLYNNTLGYYNVAVGDSTLYNNTIGISNTAIGNYSLLSNTCLLYTSPSPRDS